jgi:hypothetical protein
VGEECFMRDWDNTGSDAVYGYEYDYKNRERSVGVTRSNPK